MTSFRPDPRFKAGLQAQAEYKAMLRSRTEDVQVRAEQMAPRGATGDYAAGFRVTLPGTFARLSNVDPFAHLVEWGSINNPAYAVLRRAVLAAGLQLVEE